MIFFKKTWPNLLLLSLTIFLTQCQGEVKKEDLIKKRDNVKENLKEVKEDIDEAYALKEKYLEQQKDKMISQLEDRQLEVEVEIEKLQGMLNDSKHVADNDIISAIKKYQAEKARIRKKIEKIRKAADKNWIKGSQDFDKQIETFQKSMDGFMKEIEQLEALKADSV